MVKRIIKGRNGFFRFSPCVKAGFTLVELLTVVAIMGILVALTIPALSSLSKSGGFTRSIYDMQDSLNLARSYAVAENTYVYIGLTQVSPTQNPAASPQVTGLGRVVLGFVSTQDGTSDATTWTTNYNSGANLTQFRKVQVFDSLYVSSVSFPAATTGGMARPANSATISLLLPAPWSPSTPFSLPLGAAVGTGKYNFTDQNSAVICFNPQGGVLFNGTSQQTLTTPQALEIDLQPISGTAAPAAPADVNQGNQAALLIDGTTGSVSIYRP